MSEERSSKEPISPNKLLSAMTERFNLLFRWFARRYFSHFSFPDEAVSRVQAAEKRGAVVYVMRYASRLDYFLFNFLFRREGIRLSLFANGINFFYYRPVLEALRIWLGRRSQSTETVRANIARLTRDRQSMFIFLRTERLRDRLRSRRTAVKSRHHDLDLLGEIVRSAKEAGSPVTFVPIALFWRKGPRPARRFVNLPYSTNARPSDIAKISSFLIAYQDLAIKIGDFIDVHDFIKQNISEGHRGQVRRLRRSFQLFLSREERVVEGPRLLPRHRVQGIVLRNSSVRESIDRYRLEKGVSEEAAHNHAGKLFREIAANPNPSFFGVSNAFVSWLFRRLFSSIESLDIEKIVRCARQHPVVLVPSHRSYFDFLILSWLFYGNYLVPPHVAARENMAFGPFGFLSRRLGAFFLRRSFDDPLYKTIFRAYLSHLVSEGHTQEFFIEGGRSRTGKSLAPRLGILSWIVEAFVAADRRDLFFVPIGISYERLVEEGSMVEELESGVKRDESLFGLLKARKFLRSRFGKAYVNFGEPISLADFLGDRRSLFKANSLQTEESRRLTTVQLGNQIVERINWAMVVNATSVAACALLGGPRRGLLRDELVRSMREISELLRLQDVKMTPTLDSTETDFSETISFLLKNDLVQITEDSRGQIVFYEESKGRALDVYRNVLVHFLAAPSFISRRLLKEASMKELREDLSFWLDLLYMEYFCPKGTFLALHLDAFVDYFERIGLLEGSSAHLYPTEKGRRYFNFLAEQTRSVLEAYHASFSAVLDSNDGMDAKSLESAGEEYFKRSKLLGEVDRRQTWSSVTFNNSMELLLRRNILRRLPGAKGRRHLYLRGPSYDQLAVLREQLAFSLGSR